MLLFSNLSPPFKLIILCCSGKVKRKERKLAVEGNIRYSRKDNFIIRRRKGRGRQMQIYITGYQPEQGKMKHRQEHQKGLSLLCYGLRMQYNLPFSMEEIEAELEKGEHGKPYFRHFPQIHFNISHSQGIAACAISDYEVGIDVEKIAPLRASVARRILAEKELEFLQTFDKAGQEEMFCRFWTLKESYLKLDGSGLTRDLREVAFIMEKDGDEWKSNCSDNTVGCYQQKIKEDYIWSVCQAEKEEIENVRISWLTAQDMAWDRAAR